MRTTAAISVTHAQAVRQAHATSNAPSRLVIARADARAEGPGAEAGEGEARALENTANTAATPDQRARRAERLRARKWLQEVTTLRRVRSCGRTSVLPGHEVTLRMSDGSAGYGGLSTCGSCWACPQCAHRIMMRRVEELGQILDWNANRGGTTALMTLTVRHHKGNTLEEMWKGALRSAWRKMTEGRAWKETRKELGITDYVRAFEVTFGDHGPHCHFHVALLADGPISHEMAECLGAELFDQWQDAVESLGYSANEKGFDLHVATATDHLETLGKYLAKSMSWELAGGSNKTARKEGSRTPFQVLKDFIDTGNMDDLDLWREYERVSKGQRAIVTSRGLKAKIGIGEVTDEEICEDELDGPEVLIMPDSTWKAVHPVAHEVLDVAETRGLSAVLDWFAARDLTVRLTPAGYRALGQEPRYHGVRCLGCGEVMTLDAGRHLHPLCDPNA